MFCSKCGNDAENSDIFCSKCGTKLTGTSVEAEKTKEWKSRALCNDGSCIGVIGEDGLCKECHKPYDPNFTGEESSDERLDRKEKERLTAERENQKKSSKNLWLFFIAAILVLGYFGKNNDSKTATIRNHAQYSSINYNLSYDSIQKKADSMTDAQFDEYEKSIIGQYVAWYGKLSDVDQNITNSDYEVKIDMDGNAFDVQFDVNKSTALGLRKGQQYNFKGEIKRATKVFGAVIVTLKNTQIN